MTSNFIVTWFQQFTYKPPRTAPSPDPPSTALSRPNLHELAQHPTELPSFVQESSVAMRALHLLAPLAWDHFPERNLRPIGKIHPVPYAPFAAACLIKLDQQLPSMGRLRQYLVDHPALVWVLGFPLAAAPESPWGFDVDASLPTTRHLTWMLRSLPNPLLQFLLAGSIQLLQFELANLHLTLGTQISLDTKHILAWVQENNPKAYVRDRFDKTRQPAGDHDCRLGCKRRHNQSPGPRAGHPTPTTDPVPAGTIAVGEFYWGYASGVVATKIPNWGEFVLAELTQPFDQPDVAYFFPLMEVTEHRLGFRPKFGAFDAAFDAFYIYDYFGQAKGFAAIPFCERGGHKGRRFSPDGLPLCKADLPMPLRSQFLSHQTLLEHTRGRYGCPQCLPKSPREKCPVHDKHWKGGGCVVTMPLSPGARWRYQIDRHSAEYQELYRQRTANERINSQAVALGIERPKLRNGYAIANLNTLIYVLINLRACHRIREHKAELDRQAESPAFAA